LAVGAQRQRSRLVFFKLFTPKCDIVGQICMGRSRAVVVMMLKAILALSVGLIGALAWHGDAMADGVRRIEHGIASKRARYVGVHKRGYVRGYLAYRRGGYSYDLYSVINTYGDARARYGGVNYFRDPFVDNQGGCCGPFDNGFFFDSGIRPHGGNSPYLN
jgi:hypothetical protein